MVVRGLVDKPARIDTPVGTLADVGKYFTPKLSRRVLHQLYLGYPDSAAARGRGRRAEPHRDVPGAAAEAPGPGGRARSGCRAPSSARFGWCPACTGNRRQDGEAVSHSPITLPSVSLK